MHHVDLTTLTLAKGGHDDRDDGLCLLEAVAYFAGERHSDRPAAGAAAWDAARERLQPTVDQLQTSAIDLFASMIRPEG